MRRRSPPSSPASPSTGWASRRSWLLAFALVLVSYAFLREIYPERALMRLAVPVLLVAFPLDVLYYVTRDALPEPEEEETYYHADLIEFMVATGIRTGELTRLTVADVNMRKRTD